MMFWILHTASLALLSTTQAIGSISDIEDIGDCFSVCSREPWESWSRCDSSCGGQRTRIRKLCCKPEWNILECLSTCHVSIRDLEKTDNCRKECVFGVYSNGDCDCEDRGYGDCCQFSNLTCHHNPCENNATCSDGDRRYNCECPYGWTGPNCNVVFTTTTAVPTTTTEAGKSSPSKVDPISVGIGVALLILIVGAICVWWCVRNYCKAVVQSAVGPVANTDANVHHLVIVERNG